jgi:hypothetical protein
MANDTPLFPCRKDSSAKFIGNFDEMSFYLSVDGKYIYRCVGDIGGDGFSLIENVVRNIHWPYASGYMQAYKAAEKLLVLI